MRNPSAFEGGEEGSPRSNSSSTLDFDSDFDSDRIRLAAAARVPDRPTTHAACRKPRSETFLSAGATAEGGFAHTSAPPSGNPKVLYRQMIERSPNDPAGLPSLVASHAWAASSSKRSPCSSHHRRHRDASCAKPR